MLGVSGLLSSAMVQGKVQSFQQGWSWFKDKMVEQWAISSDDEEYGIDDEFPSVRGLGMLNFML